MGVLLQVLTALATGEPSTYFQLYVPPNNDAVRRDAALIVTAIYDSTSFEIIDDGADGDTDDSKTGILMAGQSYVLYIRDNGINDDARYASGGVLKWDGDYFIVKANQLVFTSQSTNSDWQHDWVPSTDKKSIGQKFIIYSPPFSSSKRDVNVFAYEPNTTVSFQKISFQPKTNTGYTDVNMGNPTTVFTRTLNVGQDLIYSYTDGRDAMEAGETYLIVADKPVTVQYGALFGNERDGGGYVPSSNGSSSGQLLYFGVPFQSGTTGEQEIRIVSWDDNNSIVLERYNNGTWTAVKSFTLGRLQAGDWVGRTNGNLNYATVFRVTCTNGKRVSVFEGNWFETGSPGTSDMATMVSSENGSTAGTRFVTYMAPPGNEANAVNPFTGTAFGQQLTHLYLYSKNGASVTVKDAYTNGTKFSRTYTIAAGRYADCALTLAEWKNIYNGTGTTAGPERPYLLVESNNAISVMNSNFNDNWMCYTGSSLEQGFTQVATVSQSSAIPTDTVTISSNMVAKGTITEPIIEVVVKDGLKIVESTLTGATPNPISGDITEGVNKTVAVFDNLPNLAPQTNCTITTKVVACVGNNTGTILGGSTNSTVETLVTGKVNNQVEQSSVTQVVNVNSTNTSQLLFSRFNDNLFAKDSTDSWTASWVDINKDGYDDIFATDKRSNKPNLIYINNGNGGFVRGQNLAADSAITVTSTWADVDNDGFTDLLVLNNTRKPNVFYKNNNGNLVKDNSFSFTQNISYYHGGSFADYDNDGKADLFMCNYFPTKYNELYHNNGSRGFVKELSNAIPAEANQSIGASWADYDGDGFMDLFVPNGNGFNNSLFHNEGNGQFKKALNAVTAEGGQSVGSCWGDIDNDGDLDLLVTNSNTVGHFLYFNNGNGTFTKATTGAVVTEKSSGHGCSFADIDNDGDLDLYISSDRSFKLLFINNGQGVFTKKDDELITYNYGKAYGHAWSDFDHDGDLDLLVATHSNQPNALFTNNGNGNHWLQLALVGTVSNKSAIGADVLVLTNGVWQMREVNSQSGFGGQGSFTQHIGLGNATVADSVKIKWPSGLVQVLVNVTANQLLTIQEPQGTKVVGGVYFDNNGNGQKDADETMVGRATVLVTPANTRLYSNNEGFFSTSLNQGNYGLALATENGVMPIQTQPVQLAIGAALSTTDTIWLSATATCNGTDMGLLMGGTAIRKGFSNNQFTIIASNNSRQPLANMTVKLKMPNSIIPATPSLAWGQVEQQVENGSSWNTYSWPLNNMPAFGSQLIQFMHSNSSALAIGDTVAITGWVEANVSDCNVQNNSLAQTYKVVGAIDPNDIQVAPVGYGTQGYIQATQPLTYTIRFQNVGNHRATAATITDMLPMGMDMSSLQVVAQSHEGMAIQRVGNTVVFTFDNINLSDSASDEANSHGYIIFTVQPQPGIAAGTVLRNRATIQFDHYEPVETNTVVNTIQSKKQEAQMIEMKAYPNPAFDMVYVSLQHIMGKFTNKKINRVELLDLNGRVILSKQFESNAELRIDLPEWMNGFYLLKVIDSEKGVYTKKLVVNKVR